MWLLLTTISAVLLGFYDVSKKKSLKDNAVIPVLLLNTLFASIILLPFILLSQNGIITEDSLAYTPTCSLTQLKYIFFKSCIVLSSWILGYIGLKHLPITIVGPINATRPVMVILGAMLIYGERLNFWQTLGIVTAVIGLYLLSRSSKKEGINFKNNKWILCTAGAAMLGACSAIYDKYLVCAPASGGLGISKMAVLCWFNIFQFFMMLLVFAFVWWPTRKTTPPFQWRWSIILISIFISLGDFTYFYALQFPGAMLSIVSMLRRSSVVVSFLCGAILFKEKNLSSKAIDLVLVLVSMIFLYLGSSK